MTYKAKNKNEQLRFEQFNKQYPKGTKVKFRTSTAKPYELVTIKETFINSVGEARVFFEEINGFCSIDSMFVDYTYETIIEQEDEILEKKMTIDEIKRAFKVFNYDIESERENKLLFRSNNNGKQVAIYHNEAKLIDIIKSISQSISE